MCVHVSDKVCKMYINYRTMYRPYVTLNVWCRKFSIFAINVEIELVFVFLIVQAMHTDMDCVIINIWFCYYQ